MAITPRYVRNLDGSNDPVTIKALIGASQTINEGDMLQVDIATGLLVVAVAASTTIIGVAAKPITTGVSPTAQDNIPVNLMNVKGGIFRLPVTGGPVTQLSVMSSTLYDISNKTTLNFADTTGGMFRIVAFNNTLGTADVTLVTGVS
ncbi:hypothetical protein [Paenibacillus qinlingensis]|uniref:Uncharacterized protein n=1 Tax=Paenibacillus qinlingensis TaxID=1837343 RepID=A0ABU1P6Q1_9BACL|nr:hypothetical protein [Paenibacillus qinlingensis]MDR6555440.1 hypothetical protein [Paenibacillus qinlingensis]